MVDMNDFFSYFSGLKPNVKISKTASIGVLQGAQVVVCGMRCKYINNNIWYSFFLQWEIKRGKNFMRL